MKAVKGSVVSSKPISLSKAADMLSDFAESGACSRPEIAAYVRRASTAFNELAGFHSEIKAARKQSQLDAPDENDESQSRKKRMRCDAKVGDRGEIRGVSDAHLTEKISGSGAKLVENGGVSGLEEVTDGSRKIKLRKIMSCTEEELMTKLVPGEKLLEYGNAIGLQGRNEKSQRREKWDIKDEERINLERKGEKMGGLKGHENKEKKNKEKREVSYDERSNFEKKKKAEEATDLGNMVEKMNMKKVESNYKEKSNLHRKMEVKMEEARHEKVKMKNKDNKRKREGGDEEMSNLNKKQEKKVKVKEETHENERTMKHEKFENKERDKINRHRNGLNIEEQGEFYDTSEQHKKKKRRERLGALM